MRMSSTVLTLAVVAFVEALPSGAADATGKWKAEFDTQIGVQKYTFDLKADGEKLTGMTSFERMGEQGQVELKEGKVKGDEVFFVELLNFDGNEIRIKYTGKVAGDEIKLTRKVGDFATEDFVAKRVKD